MITPRTTRLVRVSDLRAFRAALVRLACGGDPLDTRDRLVVVPTRAAGAHLLRTIEHRGLRERRALLLPDAITPGELPYRCADRLDAPIPALTPAEREVLLGLSCRAAVADGVEPPFRLRAGLIAEILAFYDALARNQCDIATFERRVLGILEPGASYDRGAERLVRQTRFLASAFRHFERRCADTGMADEHRIRQLVMTTPAGRPVRHVVVAVGDAASDPHGLAPADWDLLARVPGLERLDVVATDQRVAGAFHERIHRWLPGIEETRFEDGELSRPPHLVTPDEDGPLTSVRDREEEVAGFARWVRHLARTGSGPLDRMALVVRRPLPYVYVARDVLASAGVPCQMFDTLPLAAEPFSAAFDLVCAFVERNAAREPAVALLRSPHFHFEDEAGPVSPRDVAALNRALSEAGYLGDPDALAALVARWGGEPRAPRALRAGQVVLALARELAPLRTPAPCAAQLGLLLEFIDRHRVGTWASAPEASGERLLRARTAVLTTLASLRDAHSRFDDAPVPFGDVATMIRRWIDGQTFAPRTGDSGVHVVDADSAAFGEFDVVQLAGLVDGEWPERPRRSIFYSTAILRELGWPSEADRSDAARAAFRDLLRLPAVALRVSAFALEDEALVPPSAFVDELDASGLEAVRSEVPRTRVFQYEALALDPPAPDAVPPAIRAWARRRLDAPTARGQRRAPGKTGGEEPAAYSLSALERYQDCPFKFFASDVLRLEELPEDEPSLSPRARGRFIHEVFQRFFESWDARGHGTITPARLAEARGVFADVAEPLLARLPEADAALERARLFGTAIDAGILETVLGIEAARPQRVRERWLEYRLDGEFTLGAADGRRAALRGVADRIDLLEGNRLRVVDYKTGSAPNPKRALQVPIYALCAQERLQADGSAWTVDEAAYVAFSGRRALVPVVKAGAAGDTALAAARDRLFGILDAIEAGAFPPRPHDPVICTWCAYPSVCRKDYVGDE